MSALLKRPILLTLSCLLVILNQGLASDRLTPFDVARLREVVSARISPDGGQVAYTLSVSRTLEEQEDGPAWVELHLIDLNAGRQRPFITGEVNISSIDWTPDGSGISFLAKRGSDQNRTLYVIPVDGGEARKAASLDSDILAYSWSVGGRKVALLAVEAESEDAKELRERGFSQRVVEEDYRSRRVYVVDAFEQTEEAQPLPVEGSIFGVYWSPVDDRLAVTVAPRPLVDDSYMYKKIQVLDAHSGQVLARIDNPGKLGQMAWSPDGESLAIIAAADIHDSMEGRLVVASARTGAWRELLPDHQGHISRLAWLDSRTLGYLNDEGVWTHYESIGSDGAGRKRILKGVDQPAFTSLSISDDGQKAAFVASLPQHPREVFVMSSGQGQPKRVTDSNPWLAQRRLAPQQVVRFKARDGLELEGILIRPLDERPGRRYPLVLTVHGGPESHHRNDWLTSYSNPGQILAARGFAVFYTNYRGSTGRGVEFARLSLGDPAGKEFDDLVDAVDHLISTGLVDRNRVGVTGGSYGGYATAWCSTRYSDRFAAGVMFVGISDKISKVGTTDIPDEEFYVHANKRPWDNWQFFLERSPIFYAGQSRTPLLILHGQADPRVNVGQSREMYRHMKLRSQAPVRLVLYPGEGHGNRRAASRLDYSLRSLRWLEHYLKGAGGDPPPVEVQYEEEVAP